MTGMKDVVSKLKQRVAALTLRNARLAAANRKLTGTIAAGRRTERALRESEEHLRELFYGACQMEENLRNLSNRVLHLQEEERKHLSRELHDEVGQALTAISVTLGALQNNGLGHSPTSHKKLADAQELLQSTMVTVHDFTRELRPRMLDELGLLPALRSYLKNFSRRTGVRVRMAANILVEQLDDSQKTVLYRVAQESLTNVAKHAQANRVNVEVFQKGGAVYLQVADNGKSFREDAANSARRKQRLGLLGMQEPVRLVNGKFTITPRPGKGTTVKVEIPLAPKE